MLEWTVAVVRLDTHGFTYQSPLQQTNAWANFGVGLIIQPRADQHSRLADGNV